MELIKVGRDNMKELPNKLYRFVGNNAIRKFFGIHNDTMNYEDCGYMVTDTYVSGNDETGFAININANSSVLNEIKFVPKSNPPTMDSVLLLCNNGVDVIMVGDILEIEFNKITIHHDPNNGGEITELSFDMVEAKVKKVIVHNSQYLGHSGKIRTVVIDCPYCGKEHRHGTSDEGEDIMKYNWSHKSVHCGSEYSGDNSKGYYISIPENVEIEYEK